MDEKPLKWVLAHIEDEIASVARHHCPMQTSFYSPYEVKAIEICLKQHSDISYILQGGYAEAERTTFLLYPTDMDPSEASDFSHICILELHWNTKYYSPEHRDILGALLGLGIKREKIGDIIVQEEKAYLVLETDLMDYMMLNLTKVGKTPVMAHPVSPETLIVPDAKVKSIRTTVASPRLDSLVGACFGISRTKVLPLITSGNVRVNWEVIQKIDYLVDEGAMLSVRGLGRAKVKEFGHTTKKDRLSVILERFI